MSTMTNSNNKRQSLRVLVCSGNLGNAEPDVKSIEAWIPANGNCCEVVENHQQYPLLDENGPLRPSPVAATESFDLIVLGLQESTFIPKAASQEVVDMVVKNSDDHDKKPDVATNTTTDGTSNNTPTTASTSAHEETTEPLLGTCTNTTTSNGSDHSIPRKVSNHVKDLTAQTAQKTKELLVTNSTSALHQKLQDRLPSYKRQLSYRRGEMRLLIYVHTNALPQINNVSTRAQNTGAAGLKLPNKGGIVAEVSVNDNTTTLAFVTCHLEAHEGLHKYKIRCETMGDILQGTTQQPYPDPSLNAHYCFVFGDLNFRTRYQGHIYVKEQGEDVQALVKAKDWTTLNQADELRKALDNHECLMGFQTPICNFPPTFKVERDQAGFVYQNKRTPSYADRILWRTGCLLHNNLRPLCYEPIDQFITSDHKPIRGAFEIKLNEHKCSLPECHHRSPMFRHLPWRHSHGGTEENHAKLNIFLSDIECDIFPTNPDSQSSSMDTYVSLMSTPAHLLLPPPTRWQGCLPCVGKEKLDDIHRLLAQWPHTRVAKNTMNPKWGNDEEIHCSLQGHDPQGHAYNLGGALLHIAVIQSPDEDMIGCFPVNLEYLFRLCHGDDIMQSEVEELLAADHGITMHTSTSNSTLVSWDINGPLLKNGRQQGVLRCSLDAWWTHDGLAHAVKAKSVALGLASNDARITNALEGKSRNRWWRRLGK